MKNNISANILFGLATGFAIWFLNEFWIYLYTSEFTSSRIAVVISGGLIGTGFGASTLMKGGFFTDNLYKIKRGVLFGALLGLAGGLTGFALVDQINQQVVDLAQQPVLAYILYSVRWLVLALFIGIAAGLRDNSSTIMIRSLIGSGVAGLGSGIIISAINLFAPVYFISRGIDFIIFGILLILALDYVSVIGRKAWIKGLNGQLEGTDFELLQEIHYLGTQSNDDINLKSYPDIRPSHAKLVRYYSGYSLVDNDPFWQTYVNFRNIKEQPLKNGDIIKVGKALFQYCSIG
ncbi:MAG: FHA domain-containing protein [bacterium]